MRSPVCSSLLTSCLLLGLGTVAYARGLPTNYPVTEPLKFLLLTDLAFLSQDKSMQKLTPVMERLAKPLADYGYKPILVGEAIPIQNNPHALLTLVEQSLADKRINAVFFYNTIKAKNMNMAAVQYMTEMISSMGIPLMTWILETTVHIKGNADTEVLVLSPRIRDYCLGMLGLMRHYIWDQFSILTSRLEGHEEFRSQLEKLTSQDEHNDGFEFKILSKVIVEPETQHSAIEGKLLQLKASDTRVILLYMDDKEAEILFEVAHKLDMTGAEYVWIAAHPTLRKPLTRRRTPASFPTGMLGLHHETSYIVSDVLTSNVELAISIWAQGVKNMLDAIKQENSPFANLTVKPDLMWGNSSAMRWAGGPILLDFMKNLTLEDPGVEFYEDGTSARLKLNIYNVVKDGHTFKQIGQWQRPKGLDLQDITWPGNQLSPPTGKPSRYFLKVVTLREEPYVVYNDPDQGKCPRQAKLCRIATLNESLAYGNDTTNSSIYQCCSGLCIDLLNLLSERMRFDYDLFQVEDGLWGAQDEDTGEWNGLVRSIMEEKADMVVTSLKITPERNQMIDFSVPFLETGITIIVAVRDGVISPTAFLEPYDYPSWCLILVFSVHASGAAIFIFEWLSPSGLDRGNKPIRGNQQEHRFSLFRSFWLIWAMLLKATVNVDNPRGVSSRFLASIWALFAVVFTASYTANLAAFMITKEDYDKLEGIKDWRLVRPETHKPPFKFGTIPSGSTETNLKKFHRDMYEYMRKYNRSSVEEGIKAVKDGQINAFIYDATVLEYKAGRDDLCKLRTVGNWYAMTGYGIGFPRGSKWIEEFNKHLVELQYQGQLERLQKYWLAGACKKNEQQGESSQPLGILNFTSAFILLAGGMLLGGSLLLLEHIYFKFFRSRLRKWDKCGCCGLVSLSMGKSLTFEQSVREAIDLQKHYKCKNPVCETHTWKLKHELDLALLKIDNLQKQMGDNGIVPDRRPPTIWRNQGGPRGKGPPPAIGWKTEVNNPPIEHPPAAIGWKPGIVNERDDPPPGAGWRPEVHGAPSWNAPYPPRGGEGVSGEPSSRPRPPPGAATVYPYPPWNYDDSPQRPKRQKGEKSNKKGSKSLPTSPMKRSATASGADSWKQQQQQQQRPQTYEEAGNIGNNIDPGGMKRTTSFPNTRDSSSTSPGPRRPGDKKTRHHKGNVYVEVDVDQVEKETVL